jgi:hypothetical protein
MIRNYIQANIQAALLDVYTENGPPIHAESLRVPQDYFFYPEAEVYNAPAVLIIPNLIDFRKDQMGANFVDAKQQIQVGVINEARTREILTYQTWRYLSAMHKVLDQNRLTSSDASVVCTVVVTRASYSGIDKRQNMQDNVFRQEVVLSCDVFHWEQGGGN